MTGLAMSACLLFPGCLDRYDVTTVVSADGTCERVITLKRDSRKLPSGAFPVPSRLLVDVHMVRDNEGDDHGQPGRRRERVHLQREEAVCQLR